MMRQRRSQLRNTSYFTILFLFGLLMTPSVSEAQISGTVFRDFNGNGMKDNSASFNETFVQGIEVKAYNAAGAQVGSTQTTSASGAYAFTGLTLPVRIEFSNLPSGDFSGPLSSQSLSSVQYHTVATTSANLAVNYPAQYCQGSPYLVSPCYVNNRPTGAGTEAIVKYPNTASGTTSVNSYLATASQVGSTWGLAYNKVQQIIYASAFVKRHVSMIDNDGNGKEDIGAIYMMTPTGSPALWLDLATLGVDVGLSLMPTIAVRALPTDKTQAARDALMFDLVGKIGLGDIDISDDSKLLYVVNLFDKKVYTIDVATKTLVGAGIAVPNACTGGTVRPFGLAYHRNKLYVGAVCDGATSQDTADVKANLYRLDGGTFTNILSFPLSYFKGSAEIGYNNQWYAWRSSFYPVTGYINPPEYEFIYPQPIFADIQFDTKEELILVFNDRLGHQTGYLNYGTNTTDNNLYTGIVGGDILRAALVNGTYVLERNATVGGVTTAGANNNQGPGGGEFYFEEKYDPFHEETVMGGAAIMAGSGLVAVNLYDPIEVFSGGTAWMNNQTGTVDRAYQIFKTNTSATFGKANGLGAVAFLCDAAAIEIGNAVWNDANGNGIYDANESGIDGVIVELYDGATKVGTTTTANGGRYLFNAATVNLNGATGVKPNTAYTIKIAASQFNNTGVASTPLSNLTLTTANATSNGLVDVADNDATAVSGIATIAYTTGNAGENDHSLDFGFSCIPPTIANVAAQSATCTNGTANSDAQVSVTGIVGMVKYAYGTNGTNGLFAINATASTAASINLTSLANPSLSTTYTFRIWGADTTCYNDTTVVLTPSVCPITQSFNYSRTFATCTGSTANNNGKITLISVTSADRYAISIGSIYTGIAYAAATTIGTLPIDVQTNIPNAGAVYTLRMFNGSDAVYKDTVISMAPRYCESTCPPLSGTYQDIPMSSANNNMTFTVDGGYIKDNNATGGNYSNNLNRTVTIYAPVGQVLLRFKALDILAGDVLTIYDGTSITAPVLASFTNVNSITGVPQIESSSSCLTFHFTSDASGVAQGWEIEYSTGNLKIPTCFGGFSRVRNAFIQPNTSITILDNYTAFGNAPVCIAQFDANKNIAKNDVGFCIDAPLNTATYAHSIYYGMKTFTLDTLLPNDITKLQAARITWLLKNAASLGYNITVPDDARTMQQGIWQVLGQVDSCNAACVAAKAAVSTEPVEPIISLTGCNTKATGQSINYQLVTNSAKLVLRVSDGGNLPVLCGTNPSGTTLTDSILTIGGTGTRTVNLCLTRNTATSVSLRATDTLSLNNTQLTVYQPCDSSIQRFLSSQTLPNAYSETCGIWVCEAPTITNVVSQPTTCTNGVANNDASVSVTGIVGMTKYAYRTNATDGLWANTATASTASSINLINLTNPSLSTTYTFRIWGADTTCYNDTTVVLNRVNCTVLPACCNGTNLLTNGSAESGNYVANASVVDPNNANKNAVYNNDITDWERNGNVSWITDATRATDGNRFIYLPSEGLCFTRLFDLATDVSTCKTYKLCLDVAAFDANSPSGGATTSGFVLEGIYYNASFSTNEDIFKIKNFTDVSTNNAATNPMTISSWNNIQWKRITVTFTLPAATIASPKYFKMYLSNALNSYVASDGKGILLDNVCLTEVTDPTWAINLTKTAPTCNLSVANDNGKITLNSVTTATKYGISTGSVYTGPNYAAATTISTLSPTTTTTLPVDVKTNIPNTGGTYTLRLYNGNDACYKDTVVTINPTVCACDTTLTVSNTTICNGSSVNLFAQASGVKGTLTYSTNGTTWAALTNPTNVTPSVSTTYFIKDSLATTCLDIDTLTITVNQPVTAGTGTNPTTATCQAGSGLSDINLAGQITGATAGGTWSQTSGTAVGTALNTATGVFNPNGIAAGTYTFRYTVVGTSPCPNATTDITITIQNCCPPSVCLPVTVMRN
jgi:hypothetical protein